MIKVKRFFKVSALFSAAVLMSAVLSGNEFKVNAESTEKYVTINGNSADTAESRSFKGIGAVSSGASLRLLADYKVSSPDEYYEILNILFGKNSGAALSQIYVEMGSDINSVPCAEPAAMRSADDTPDISGNAGWQIAADALEINPDLSIGMIRTEEPVYITRFFEESRTEGLEARYNWYKACIESAYDVYGIELDYISASSDDDDIIDAEWVIYLSEHLKAEKESRYDYDRIKIGISANNTDTASEIIKNENVLAAADAIDCRILSEDSSSVQSLATKYGLELYNLNGVSPLTVTDQSAENTALDYAEGLINMYCSYGITAFSANPPTASCYSGTKYYPEGFITADTPWSGFYTVNAGLWAAEHFTRFAESGWRFVRSGCIYGSCLTLTDSQSGDYSVIAVNNSSEERVFHFSVSDVEKYSSDVNVWVSDFAESSYMENVGTISPDTANGAGTFSYTLPPYSAATFTTADFSPEYSEFCSSDNVRLALPYSDDFEYSEAELSERGKLPLYINILGGAFEVSEGRLFQAVSENEIPMDSLYSVTPTPAAALGDDSWADYSFSADVRLASSSDENYAGIGVRYNISSEEGAFSGYSLLIYGSGQWILRRGNEIIGSEEIKSFSPAAEYHLTVTAVGRCISAKINGEEVISAEEENGFVNSGRISLYSSFCGNSFDNLSVLPEGNTPYINRIDSSDEALTYSGDFSADYSSYSYFGHSHAVCDSSSAVYSGALPYSGGGFVYTGFTSSDDGKTARILYDGSSPLFIFGSFTEALSVSMDGSEVSYVQSDRIFIPPVSEKGIHTVLISDDSSAEIDFISTANPAEKGSLSFDFVGTGFGLVGENDDSSLIDVYIDGKLYDENIITSSAMTRECLYTCTGLEYSSHSAEIRIKGGSFSFDAVETQTRTTLIKESDNPKAEFPKISSEETVSEKTAAAFESISSVTEEDEASAEVSEQTKNPAVRRFVLAFAIAAAVGAVVYIFTPKDNE